MKLLDISAIKRIDEAQQRPLITDVVNDYANSMADEAQFPPVEVCWDGENYWLWDGFHRCAAREQLGMKKIAARITEGSKQHAIFMSYSANAVHGLRRSSECTKKIILKILADPELDMTYQEIATHVGVTKQYVSKIALQQKPDNSVPECQPSLHIGQEQSENEAENDENADIEVKKPENKPIVDKVGQAIPEQLCKLYIQGGFFSVINRKFDEIMAEIEAKREECPKLFIGYNATAVEAAVNNAKNTLKFTKPYAVCPYCGGVNSANCEVCKGKGFVNKATWDVAPKELKNDPA